MIQSSNTGHSDRVSSRFAKELNFAALPDGLQVVIRALEPYSRGNLLLPGEPKAADPPFDEVAKSPVGQRFDLLA